MAAKQEQFRPSLTLAEIKQICDSLHCTEPGSKLFHKLAVYYAKVNLGLNPPAYISTVKQTLEQKLGLDSEATQSTDRAAQYQARLQQKQELAPATLSKEERFNLLAAKAFAGSITDEELVEGRALEQELYGMDMGTFATPQ